MAVHCFSAACERNRDPILAVLERAFARCASVLEIGSGTGQHAVYFARALPHLTWHTSDLPPCHEGILSWIRSDGPANVRPPLALDVRAAQWPVASVDAVFSANTPHIMSWQSVESMFAGIGRMLNPGGVAVIYGPFSYSGRHTAESNARFDAALRARDPASGVRAFEEVDNLARAQGLRLAADIAMPADNRCLLWERPASYAGLPHRDSAGITDLVGQ
jgi:cyclopropane fatty-acyl-phospholipid synthase-like methyltransferase